MHFSADPDARWVKKGSKSTLGSKALARTDEEGFVDKVHTTPANQAESPTFGQMIEGAKAQRVLADKAYASKANRASLRGKHRDGILRKAARNRPLRVSEKRFNKMISKRRFRVEQCFGTMKRLFGLHRARYFGVAQPHAQTAMAAIGQNLLKAANKIALNPQTSATAETKPSNALCPLKIQRTRINDQIHENSKFRTVTQTSFARKRLPGSAWGASSPNDRRRDSSPPMTGSTPSSVAAAIVYPHLHTATHELTPSACGTTMRSS